MAEKSLFWTDSTGDGGPYSQTQLAEWLEYLFTTDQAATEGVLEGADNELAVSGASSPVAVATGAAIVKGRWYRNSAAVNVAVASPAAATRIDRIVLRADWTAQTVRIARVAGVEGGAAPALTQVDGTTWEISLAQVSITTGGAITLTDERAFCHFGTRVSAAMLDAAIAGNGLAGGAGTALSVGVDNSTIEISSDALRVKDAGIVTDKINALAVTTGKIDNLAVSTAKLADAAVTTDKIYALNVTSSKIDNGAVGATKLASDAVETAKIKDLNVTAGKLAADAVETAKIKDSNVTNAKLSANCQRVVGELMENAAATLGGSDGRRMVVSGVAYESWVHCDGGAAVNGVTIPDTRDRVIGGASGTNAAASTAGAQTANLAHPHGVNITSAGDSTELALGELSPDVPTPVSVEGHTHLVNGNTASALSATQDIRQPTYYVYRFIYVG